jgi:3-phenylpropionate/trans-cinnamate dioxygenase ferredoxin subunit
MTTHKRGEKRAMSQPAKEPRWVKVANADDIQPGSCMLVTVEGQDIDVFNVEGQYCAIGDVCTHAETSLSEGDFYEDMRGWVIECPLHGSQFDVCTGEAVSLPATGNAGKYEVCVREGAVYVNPDPVIPFGE